MRKIDSAALSILLAFGANSLLAQNTIQVEIPDRGAVDLETLQQEIRAQGGTFEIGDNPLEDLPISELASTVPPTDLPIQASIQSGITQKIASATTEFSTPEAEIGQFNDDRRLCNPDAASFDWRDSAHVTPVRTQGRCGACWAFASMAAFESSNSIVNGLPVDGSEQDLLDCSGSFTCEGGWFNEPLIYLRDRRGRLESQVPYSGVRGQCVPRVAASLGVQNWGYVERLGGIPSPGTMKKAICDHGPVAVAIFATPLLQRYRSGIFNEFNSGEGSSSVNHGVLIIGWDDEEQSWIIKNSWGPQWGESGFMRIRYGSNNVGYGATWVEALPGRIEGQEDLNAAIQSAITSANREVSKSLEDSLGALDDIDGFLSDLEGFAGALEPRTYFDLN